MIRAPSAETRALEKVCWRLRGQMQEPQVAPHRTCRAQRVAEEAVAAARRKCLEAVARLPVIARLPTEQRLVAASRRGPRCF
mmetsp:Transcript_6155/g.19058  ORF Transcript_6155/g.19058 Transcript_6155/m.19058 type:complete len:82 (-) Transcript_6155:1004-1249(-)